MATVDSAGILVVAIDGVMHAAGLICAGIESAKVASWASGAGNENADSVAADLGLGTIDVVLTDGLATRT